MDSIIGRSRTRDVDYMKVIRPLTLEQKILVKHLKLDCGNQECHSTDVIAVGNYHDDDHTGLFVDVKCNACGQITQTGDGEFFSESVQVSQEDRNANHQNGVQS
jgi:hypothetical protein